MERTSAVLTPIIVLTLAIGAVLSLQRLESKLLASPWDKLPDKPVVVTVKTEIFEAMQRKIASLEETVAKQDGQLDEISKYLYDLNKYLEKKGVIKRETGTTAVKRITGASRKKDDITLAGKIVNLF